MPSHAVVVLALAAAILLVHQCAMRLRATHRARMSNRAIVVPVAPVPVSPVFLFIHTLLVAAALETAYPLAAAPNNALVFVAVGIILTVLAEITMRAASRELKRCSTTESTREGASELARQGPFARSRNPIYAGMLVLYAGICVAACSPWAVILFPPLFMVLHFTVVRREERDLRERFGVRYADYAAQVPRYL